MEKIYSQIKKEEGRIEEVKIEIPKEDWETLEIIAKRVGGDFGMEVKQGPPYLEKINPITGEEEKIPYIAFENLIERSITFNPLFVKENPRKAKRMAAHEGAHRAITRGDHEIGLSKEQNEKLSSPGYIGFHSFRNIGLEDPRVNNWDTGKFPGLIELNKEVYDEQLQKENAQFIAPEVTLIISKLGRYPRYAEAASELLRFWHQGRYSKELKPEVEKFLKRTQGLATEYQNNIPSTDKALDEKEVIKKGQECFRDYHEYIWPEVKKLVEMDLHIEEQRQMFQEFKQKQKELEKKQQEMERAQREGNKQGQKELEKKVEGLKKDLDPFNGLPKEVREELQEQIDRAIGGAAEELTREIEEKQKQIEETTREQEKLDKEIKDLEEKANSASGKEKEELEGQIEQKKGERLAQKMKGKRAEGDLKDIQEALSGIESGEEMPYPADKLSDKTKGEIEKLFAKLPHGKQKDLREKAKKQLEDFEDAINKEMEGKLNEDKPKSHRERKKREEQERGQQERLKKEREERKALESRLEQMRHEKMTEYDKTYEAVVDIINSLCDRLKRFFLAERHPKWQKGYPTGQRLDLEKAMQAEADPGYLEEIWQRKTIPRRFDYRFSILVDLSGSMKREKKKETFKGLVVLVEALERLGIQYEVIGFSNKAKAFKEWREKLNQGKRKELAEMEEWGGGGTNTAEATEISFEHIEKNRGKNNFILTLTDGLPDNSKAVLEILKKTRDRNIKTVGCGLGPGTEFVRDYYPASLVLEHVKPTEQQRERGEKDFGEALAGLLEDMIRHPEKY